MIGCKKRVVYIDRQTQQEQQEKVYGEWALHLLYGEGLFSRISQFLLLPLLCRLPWISSLFGWWQRRSWTKKKILPFIEQYAIDAEEFLLPPDQFSSFNDFFIRKLKSEARSIASGENVVIAPADGRYRFYRDVAECHYLSVKGETFSLATFLNDASLAKEYQHASCLIARLCPSDYHRFHFSVGGIPGEARAINGYLYSVNPIALSHNGKVLLQNKRFLTPLETEWGRVLLIEIGATNVGTVHQTYVPGKRIEKGEEKGYFSFGGSALVTLFPHNFRFDEDLVALFSATNKEIRCLFGQSLGILGRTDSTF